MVKYIKPGIYESVTDVSWPVPLTLLGRIVTKEKIGATGAKCRFIIYQGNLFSNHRLFEKKAMI